MVELYSSENWFLSCKIGDRRRLLSASHTSVENVPQCARRDSAVAQTMSQSNSNPPSPSPSLPSKLTSSLQAARRGESPTPSTPTRRTQGILTPTARKQALRDFYNLDKSKPTSSITDLDREDFDGKDYVDKLVRERNLSTLIMMENDLVQGAISPCEEGE